jgi:hypothetical protein
MPRHSHESIALQRAASGLDHTTTLQVAQAVETGDLVPVALRERRQTFLSRMFPDVVEKARLEAQLLVIEKETEFFARAMDMVRETQLANLRTMMDSAQARTRGEVHKSTLIYLTQQRQEISEALGQQSHDMMQRLTLELDAAVRLPHPLMRDIEINRITDEAVRFNLYCHDTLTRFEILISQELNH